MELVLIGLLVHFNLIINDLRAFRNKGVVRVSNKSNQYHFRVWTPVVSGEPVHYPLSCFSPVLLSKSGHLSGYVWRFSTFNNSYNRFIYSAIGKCLHNLRIPFSLNLNHYFSTYKTEKFNFQNPLYSIKPFFECNHRKT